MNNTQKQTRSPSATVEPAPVKSVDPAQARDAALALQKECEDAFTKNPPHEIGGWRESRNRIHSLCAQMKSEFVDRDHAVEALLAALISRTGCVLLGPAGTAKSLLVRRIAKACDLRIGSEDSNYFEYLLTAHTMPEEIFGPTDIAQLMQQPPLVHRRTEGKLPHAELAFLDEVFRGGSHILNTLLTILNERKFHNGSSIEDVPLVSFIGAANAPPQTDELKAFFDRFPVRIWVKTVLDVPIVQRHARGFALIKAELNSRNPKAPDAGRPSMGDFRKLWSILCLKNGHNLKQTSITEFSDNFARFAEIGELSDRSFVQLWYFAGALDLVRGSDPGTGTGVVDCFRFIAPTLRAKADIETRLLSIASRKAAAGN